MRHVALTCVNHPNQRWHTKSIAWSVTGPREGYYTGSRNIFHSATIDGEYVPDCPCKAIDLRLAPEDNGLDIDV